MMICLPAPVCAPSHRIQGSKGVATANTLTKSFIKKAALEEAPCGAVMQIKITVGAEILPWEKLAVGQRYQSRKLRVCQFLELLRGDRLPDSKSSCLHGQILTMPSRSKLISHKLMLEFIQ
jgi:hypothetical protein